MALSPQSMPLLFLPPTFVLRHLSSKKEDYIHELNTLKWRQSTKKNAKQLNSNFEMFLNKKKM